MEALFENVMDEAGFQDAIKDSIPDTDYVNDLKQAIENNEKSLKKVENDLYLLIESLFNGFLKKAAIKIRNRAAKMQGAVA